MATAKPTTRWAFVSLVCGILGGCGLAGFALWVRLEPFSDTTGVTAGLWLLCLVFPLCVICLLAVISGVVALLRIRGGQYGGRGTAVTGIILGCSPLAVTGILLGCLG